MNEWDDIFNGETKDEPIQQCPLLGALADHNTAVGFPNEANHCYKLEPPAAVPLSHQDIYCLSGEHAGCPILLEQAAYFKVSPPAQSQVPPAERPSPATQPSTPQRRPARAQRARRVPKRRWPVVGPLALLVVALLSVLGLLLWHPGLRAQDAPNELVAVKPTLASPAEGAAADTAVTLPPMPTTAALVPEGTAPGAAPSPVLPTATATEAANLAVVATVAPSLTPTGTASDATAVSDPTATPEATATPPPAVAPGPTTAAATGSEAVDYPIVTLPTVQAQQAAPTAAVETAVVGPQAPPRTTLRGQPQPGSALNLYSGPGANYAVVAQLEAAQQVTVLERSGNGSWLRIQLADGRAGWVHAAQASVSQVQAAPTSSPPVAPPPVTAWGTAVVTAGALNVRSGPSLAYATVAVVYQGQFVDLLARSADGAWVQVQTESGAIGWVSAVLLQTNVALSSLPLNASAPPGATAVVATGALNVRSGPGVDFPSLAVVYQGEMVVLIGRNRSATWVQIQTGSGLQGWVNAGLITPNVPLGNLPRVN